MCCYCCSCCCCWILEVRVGTDCNVSGRWWWLGFGLDGAR